MTTRQWVVRLLMAATLAGALHAGGPARAADPSPALADPAREGLKNLGSNWYDAEHDSLRRIDPQTPEPEETSKFVRNSSDQSGSAGMMFSWTTVGLLLAGLAILMIYMFAHSNRAAPPGAKPVTRDLARIEALPYQLDAADGNLLDLARRQYEAANYAQAMVYLYSYYLVELDRHQVIRLTRGKTNRQYLREAGRRNGLRVLLEPCMVAFEDVFFGHRSLDRGRFEASWLQLDRFNALMAAGEGA